MNNLSKRADKALRTAEWAEENGEKNLLDLQRARIQEIDDQLPDGVTAGDIAQEAA